MFKAIHKFYRDNAAAIICCALAAFIAYELGANSQRDLEHWKLHSDDQFSDLDPMEDDQHFDLYWRAFEEGRESALKQHSD